jgi:uncharacterized protein (DUF305 family)
MKQIIIIAGALTIALFFSACNEGTKSTSEKSVMDSSKMGEHSMAGMHDEHGGMMEPMNAMMSSMKAMKMTGDMDIDFANMMIAHHQAAIDMANIEVHQGTDEALKTMAKAMIAAQEIEIAAFRKIFNNIKMPAMNERASQSTMMETMDKMMTSMSSAPMTGNMNKDFALMMIPHHEGAISMAKEQLAKGKNAELKNLAQKIIDDQTREIADMKAWLAGK